VRRCRSFVPDPSAVRDARNLVAEVFAREALSGDVCFVATLLTSELVTNAVLHARTDLEVEVILERDQARVVVKDHDTRLPAPWPGPTDATTGRGLRLVDAMASAWGTEPTEAGKVVWFDLVVDSRRKVSPGSAITQMDGHRSDALPGAT
jgi:anti-sigma regulatory factor (Ser/Thr protein kinase)